MPPPLPLTAAPTPRLDWSRADTPVAEDFDDIYFSTDGGVKETEIVFLKGCGLPERWESGEDHIIGELGFGSGLNLLTSWQAFECHAASTQRLDFISIEKFPFTADMLKTALSHWPQFADKTARLLTLWPGPVKGVHRLHLTPRVTLTLYIEDIDTALHHMSTPVDSWFLDGFSPSKNPAMWTPHIMKRLAALSHAQTQLATFTVAGSVRSALSAASFSVSKETGFGRKRHRLEARFEGGPIKPQSPSIAPLIIGGRIAGASLCRAAKIRNITPTLIQDDPDMALAASGNPAALVKPRLDLQDRPESRFFLASYLYALTAYEDSDDDIILSRGISQIAKDEKERARFEKITAQKPLPAKHLTAHSDGLHFPSALTLNPKALTALWKSGIESKTNTIARISKVNDLWQAHDADGQIIAAAKTVIIASGAGVRDIKLTSGETIAQHLALRFSRGQLTWAQLNTEKGAINTPTAYGGYAIPIGEDILLGATHDRLDDRDDYELRPEDDDHNLEKARKYLDTPLTQVTKPGRASLRVTTANTLPLTIEIEDGLWVMTGLGSRGFVFAPLLAEQLMSHLMQKAPSVTPELWSKISHDR